MKKIKLIFGVMILMTALVSAQQVRMMEIKAGYLNPKDTNSGFVLNGTYGFAVDERVDLNLGLGFFHKKYTKDTKVADTSYVSGQNESTWTRELEHSTTLLPISANVNIRIPFQPPLFWYAGAGVSYQFLFSKEKNYEDDISERRTYSGFGWELRAGIDYLIGSRSSVLLELFYNNGKVSRNVDETPAGLPVWDEVNVSGLGFRAGLRLELY